MARQHRIATPAQGNLSALQIDAAINGIAIATNENWIQCGPRHLQIIPNHGAQRCRSGGGGPIPQTGASKQLVSTRQAATPEEGIAVTRIQ